MGDGGGRWVEVPPERLVRWVESFTSRHGPAVAESGPAVTRSGPTVAESGPAVRESGSAVAAAGLPVAGSGPAVVTLRAQDGAVAECHPPFPPLPLPAGSPDLADPVRLAELMAAHAAAARTVGVLLVRLGGYAAGVFTGDPPELVAHKTGSRLVHGRSAAGGWSQHRFARRRENQAAAALRAAADTALAVLGPYAGRLDAVVLGGDRRAMAGVRADPRLAPLLAGAEDRFLTVPEPRLAVLADSHSRFRAIRIRLADPAR